MDGFHVHEDGRVSLYDRFIEDMFRIYEHYKARSEEIIMLSADRHDSPRRPERRYKVGIYTPVGGFSTYVKVSGTGEVYEYGRKELG